METKTITTEDLKQILSALDDAYYFISKVADERDEHPICEMIGKAMEAIDYVSILTINTMETKNYAELSSLKWRVEDININVERAYDAGYITEERMNKLLSMTDTDKIAFFEGVTAVQHQNSYGVFCMTDRMLANGYKIDSLDDFWADAITEYNKFLNSEFNVDSKSELDCIDDYFNNK